MADMNGFSDVAGGIEKEQAEIDSKYSEFKEVLGRGDHLSVLNWLADYSVLASRSGDAEDINLYVNEVVSQLEQDGYGNEGELDSKYSDVLHLISNTMVRLKEGKIPTGFERILADKYIEAVEQDTDHHDII